MSSNQAQGIVEYMPTASERRALRAHMTGNGAAGGNGSNESSAAQFEKLCECEKFMVAMMTVAQSRKKLRALLFKLQFRGCIHDLAHGECYCDVGVIWACMYVGRLSLGVVTTHAL